MSIMVKNTAFLAFHIFVVPLCLMAIAALWALLNFIGIPDYVLFPAIGIVATGIFRPNLIRLPYALIALLSAAISLAAAAYGEPLDYDGWRLQQEMKQYYERKNFDARLESERIGREIEMRAFGDLLIKNMGEQVKRNLECSPDGTMEWDGKDCVKRSPTPLYTGKAPKLSPDYNMNDIYRGRGR